MLIYYNKFVYVFTSFYLINREVFKNKVKFLIAFESEVFENLPKGINVRI